MKKIVFVILLILLVGTASAYFKDFFDVYGRPVMGKTYEMPAPTAPLMGTLIVNVFDNQGKLMENARISIYDEKGISIRRAIGRAVFNLPLKTLTLEVFNPGYDLYSQKIVVMQSMIINRRVVLERPETVAKSNLNVRVFDLFTDDLLHNAAVYIYKNGKYVDRRTTSSGAAKFLLNPGAYTAEATAPNYGIAKVEFTIGSRENINRHIKLQPYFKACYEGLACYDDKVVGYQHKDCSWSNLKWCKNGCKNGLCII